MPIDVQKLPDKIKEGPHWRVSFRPVVYKKDDENYYKISFDTVQKSQIRLRGWPYPYISNYKREQIRNSDYLASGLEYSGHIEYWRLYYSRQFINLFAVREKTNLNWDEKLREQAKQWIILPDRLELSNIPGFIDIINLLYHLTEIFEFASRLCSKDLYHGELEIDIQIINIEGFCLIAQYPRAWDEYYPTTSDSIIKSAVYHSGELVAKSSELALDWSIYFFNQFGWDDPSVDILKQEQEKFLLG
jgi:hypothetical protein